MLKYAGANLLQPDPIILDRVQDRLNLYWPSHQGQWSQPRPPGTDPAMGAQGLWPPWPCELNVLYWPAGASRWACGWFAADDAAVTAARALEAGVGDFEFDDGVTTVTTSLLCLPPIPAERVRVDIPGLYILPLVDARYYWWQEQAPVEVDPGVTTWAQLYAAIATALGTSITVDAVHADYLFPSPSLGQSRGPLPPLLDLVAQSCGQRIVRALNGNVRAMSAQDSLDQHLSNLLLYEGERLEGHKLDLGA
jgi:hypothetical protein